MSLRGPGTSRRWVGASLGCVGASLRRLPSGRAALCLIVLASVSAPALALLWSDTGRAQQNLPVDPGIEVRGPRVWLAGDPYELEVTVRVMDLAAKPPSVRVTYDRLGAQPASADSGQPVLTDEGRWRYSRRVTPVNIAPFSNQQLWVQVTGTAPVSLDVWVIPGWAAALPTLLAVVMAITLRQVILALFAGLWFGAWLTFRLSPMESLLRIVDTYALGALVDDGRASILVFTMLLGGMVGIISRTRGARILAERLKHRISSSRRGQLATWLMGLVVFVDDYANALLVGTSMRAVYDRLKISREKLAFIVDATAAPVSSIALVSSWVGVELGYIADQYQSMGLTDDAYGVFLSSLKYRFYPVLMLVFGLMIALTGRDFGPMRRAELNALLDDLNDGSKTPPLSPRVKANPNHALLCGIIPLAVLIGATLMGLYIDGLRTLQASPATSALAESGNLQAIFANADATKALLGASLLACMAALITATSTRLLSLTEAMDAWLDGVKSMVLACVVLVLAWSLSRVCRDLHTADFFVQLVEGLTVASLVPAAIFVSSALIAFSTGTSWGTMAIVFPVGLPLVHDISGGDPNRMFAATSAILAGAVWGDHCSPISDTTIMSATAAGCRPAAHVNTQLPYALAVGFVALLFGDVAVGLGLYPWWAGFLLGIGALYGVVRTFGRHLPADPVSSPEFEAEPASSGERKLDDFDNSEVRPTKSHLTTRK